MAMKVRYTVVGGEVIAEKRSGVRREYVPDPLGSTIALLDSTQGQTDTFTYWPYGEVASRTGTTETSFQFVGTWGYYSDSDSRKYVRARYLDSSKSRWLTKDPIGFKGKDYNLYRYVDNKPITVTDKSGTLNHAWCFVFCLPALLLPEVGAALYVICLDACDSALSLGELDELMCKVGKQDDRCYSPKSTADCLACPGTGKDLELSCMNCCAKVNDETCEEQCSSRRYNN